jgi:hypothetical protein
MKRVAFNVLSGISVLVFFGTLVVWIRGSDWLGHRKDFVRQDDQEKAAYLTDVGDAWTGIYSNAGKIGFLRVELGVSALDQNEMPSRTLPVLTSGWFWNRHGETDSYFGTLDEELQYADVSWRIPYCLEIFRSIDAGMRHFQQVRGVMVDTWLLVVVWAAIPILRTFKILRHRKRALKGLCVRCGYDLRASPNRCPECGTPPVSIGNHLPIL